MVKINKFSPLHIEATFKDENGVNKTPTTIQWRIWNSELQEEVLTWQDIAVPAAVVNFAVEGQHHDIVDDNKVREAREIQVRIDVGLPTLAYEVFPYMILNKPRTVA